MAAEAAANPNANAERRSIFFIRSSLCGKRLYVFGGRSETGRRIRRVLPLAEHVAITAKRGFQYGPIAAPMTASTEPPAPIGQLANTSLMSRQSFWRPLGIVLRPFLGGAADTYQERRAST